MQASPTRFGQYVSGTVSVRNDYGPLNVSLSTQQIQQIGEATATALAPKLNVLGQQIVDGFQRVANEQY